MNNKTKLMASVICTIMVMIIYSVNVKNNNSGLSCEAETYYKWFKPVPGKTVNRYVTIHFEEIDSAGEGKGRISFTSNIHYGHKIYYLRRDVIVSYQVGNDELYFFKTLYINKDSRDSIPAEAEKLLVPEILYKVGSLSSYTIRKAGKQGYFFSLTDTPLFFCNRL